MRELDSTETNRLGLKWCRKEGINVFFSPCCQSWSISKWACSILSGTYDHDINIPKIRSYCTLLIICWRALSNWSSLPQKWLHDCCPSSDLISALRTDARVQAVPGVKSYFVSIQIRDNYHVLTCKFHKGDAHFYTGRFELVESSPLSTPGRGV